MTKPQSRPNRLSISLSDEALSIVDRYCALTGVSRAKLIDSWIIEGKETHLEVLAKLEDILKIK